VYLLEFNSLDFLSNLRSQSEYLEGNEAKIWISFHSEIMSLRYNLRLFRGWVPTSIVVSMLCIYLTWTVLLEHPTPQLLTTPKAVISNYITPVQKPIKQQWPGQDLETWKKPADLRVVGLIFFGRHTFVSILDCYLKVHSTFC
jgi:hypothetical protein